jgi:hypothetical protein
MGWDRGFFARRHVEKRVFDVARLVEKFEAIGEAFNVILRKNEAMIGGLPGNSSVFVEFEEGGGVLKIVALGLSAVGLDFAELVEALLELAGKALALDAEVGDEAMGVDDIECDFLIERDGSGGAREHFGFEQRDAVETPGGVGEPLRRAAIRWEWRVGIRRRSGGDDRRRRPGLRRAKTYLTHPRFYAILGSWKAPKHWPKRLFTSMTLTTL